MTSRREHPLVSETMTSGRQHPLARSDPKVSRIIALYGTTACKSSVDLEQQGHKRKGSHDRHGHHDADGRTKRPGNPLIELTRGDVCYPDRTGVSDESRSKVVAERQDEGKGGGN